MEAAGKPVASTVTFDHMAHELVTVCLLVVRLRIHC
ncbi:hypothetical protein FHX45_004502 [Amycolatopsis granulosa]|nr:hypothetical protein [Amycolatopsis granulosa]